MLTPLSLTADQADKVNAQYDWVSEQKMNNDDWTVGEIKLNRKATEGVVPLVNGQRIGRVDIHRTGYYRIADLYEEIRRLDGDAAD